MQRPAGTEHEAALAAQGQYMAALVLARVGLLSCAVASLQTCLQLQPEHPLAHYTLAQFLRTQEQQEAALHHMVQAWNGLMALGVPTQVLHLEMLNQLLILLDTTHQYERFPEWLAAFDRACTALRAAPLSPASTAARPRRGRDLCPVAGVLPGGNGVTDWRRHGQYYSPAAGLCGASHRPGHSTHAATRAASTGRNVRASVSL